MLEVKDKAKKKTNTIYKDFTWTKHECPLIWHMKRWRKLNEEEQDLYIKHKTSAIQCISILQFLSQMPHSLAYLYIIKCKYWT